MESNWTKTIPGKGWIALRLRAPKAQDDATPLTEDYEERDNKFIGEIKKVVVEV